MAIRRWNIFYWLLFPLGIFILYDLSVKLQLSQYAFLGFAENKQNEINVDKDVVVQKILVKNGSTVKKGQLLLQVQNVEMQEEIEQIQQAIQDLPIKTNLSLAKIEAEILLLRQQKEDKINELTTKINAITAEAVFYKNLLPSTSENQNENNIQHPKAALVKNLKDEISAIEASFNQQIKHYEVLKNAPQEGVALQNQWAKKKSFLINEIKKFDVIAPYDGVIGTVNVKEGENVQAFSSLISMYEASPPLVVAYIQERFDIKVSIGDTVDVVSMYNSNKKVAGVVMVKGNRIVEIPEKFRKIPDHKIYGIEVFIEIPTYNQFLQKEVLKVSVRQH